MLGQTLLEAPPGPATGQARRPALGASGGKTTDPGDGDVTDEDDESQARWLDRASAAVESRIGQEGT